MQIAIWIIQGLLVLAFLLAGVMKATQPASKIRENMPWANDVSDGKIKFIGVSELLGAFGLLIPQLTGNFSSINLVVSRSISRCNGFGHEFACQKR